MRKHWIVSLFLALSASGYAQDALPAHTVVEVIHDSAALYVKQGAEFKRRGSSKLGTRFSTVAIITSTLCASGRAFQLVSGEYLCTDDTAGAYRSANEQLPQSKAGEVRYAKVAIDGTPVYTQFDELMAGEYVSTLGEGFQVVVEATESRNGKTLAKIKGIGWVENEALQYMHPSKLNGKVFAANDSAHMGWMLRDAKIYRAPKRVTKDKIKKYQIVQVQEMQNEWVRIGDAAWVRDGDVGRLRKSEPPSSVLENEKWIDVDLSEQVLTAYEGSRLVFATLVSTGRKGAASETPTGEFRIWVKLRATDMANIDDSEVRRTYSVQDVPWVQFFKDAYGLHGTYWHDDFGTVKSHGCVNLAPTDAEFLFSWTDPQMPLGWSAILPLQDERATLLRIRQ